MPFEWTHFLNIAKFLFDQGKLGLSIPQEAAYRCAVSRAYYAAFGHTKTFAMDTMNFVPDGDETDHIKLRDFLKEHQKPELSRQLSRLRQWRNQSDYDNPCYSINENQTTIAIRQADTIILSLNT
jgi:uncharacterized protein (UPF0332 family)